MNAYPFTVGLTRFFLLSRSPKTFIRTAFASGVALFLALSGAYSESWNDVQIRKLQEALVWTTDYEGLVDGNLGAGTVAAISKFQEHIGAPVTGQLTSDEYIQLLQLGTSNRSRFGFSQITDSSAGVSVGLPHALVAGPTITKWGKHWDGKLLSIDTLRFGSDVSLEDLYKKLLSRNSRKVSYQRFVENDWFVIAAFEGDAAIYVRANLVTIPSQPSEIRGFSIWMSKDRPSSYQAIAPAMLSSFRYNTDQTNDASSNAPMGGELKLLEKSKVPKALPNPPPKRTIQTVGTPSSASTCLNGLGECPLVSSAFK
jgi:hypothetical protein